MKIIEGELQAKGLKFGIVISRFNEFITSKLLDGAKDALVRHGAKEDDIDVAKVPGSFEIPMIAKKMAAKGRLQCDYLPRNSDQGCYPAF